MKTACIFINFFFRYDEQHVAYVESHDWALVGDKTIAFWLMDKGKNVSNLENIVKISKTFTEYNFCHYFDGWMRKLEYFESSIFFRKRVWPPRNGSTCLRIGNNESYPTTPGETIQFDIFFCFLLKKNHVFSRFYSFFGKKS